MLTIFFFLFCILHLTLSDQWYSKSQCTQKEFANHMDINCNSNEFILIGWSHYGTKKNFNNLNSSMKCQPSENDCIMDYTHKIAELCNGVSKCEVILTQQFIHKCSDEATYLFISYQCIQNSTIVDVCSKRSLTSSNGLNLISPMFPNEYPNNMNCTCSIESKKKSNIIIDVENLSFNLQDNDKLFSFSGTMPFGISLLTSKTPLNLKFQTDETLSQSGFWIRLYGYQPCHTDEYTLGSKCIKIFSKKQTWKIAQDKCLSMNSNLIYLQDIIQEKKLANFILNNSEQQPTSFWISNNEKVSWWPWRSSSAPGKCVLRTQDGWMKRACNEEYAFICERDINQPSIPLTIQCGNAQPTIIPLTKSITTTTTTQRTTTELIEPLSSTVKNQLQKRKTNTVDSYILVAILGGISIVILSINIVICYICKRRSSQNQTKCKTQNNSNSSFTHEELQHSLMQHLYHEQTNTISSTSTSSSSSKNSQSKSNDTTTTASNLFQLSPPCSNLNPPTLYFRNPHISNDQVDYHVYETIPSENMTYTLCTTHNAFKPIIQSNTQFPRTNILYHHPDTSKQSYDTLSKISPNTMVVLPVCCHQCSTGGTLRQHVLPPQIYTRSESIV